MGSVVRLGDGRAFDAAVEEAASVLRAGGVVVLPTDTVYGVSQAVAANPGGVARLFAIKRRDPAKTVPWLVAAPEDLGRYGARVPAFAFRLAEALWPGGLTLVVPASAEVPAAYRAADGTVALRMPASSFVRAVARVAGSPLAATSANTSGRPAPTSFEGLEGRIVAEADLVVDGGATPDAQASTVVSCLGARPSLLRTGAVSEVAIREALA